MSKKPKKAPKALKYEFVVAILGPVNSYYRYVKTKMKHEHLLPNQKIINVKPADLYRLKAGLATRLNYKLKGIDSGFLVVFQSDSGEAIKYDPPKYTAKVLKTINESRALKTALKDEFSKALDSKTLFMYFLLIAGAVVVYLFMTGQLQV